MMQRLFLFLLLLLAACQLPPEIVNEEETAVSPPQPTIASSEQATLAAPTPVVPTAVPATEADNVEAVIATIAPVEEAAEETAATVPQLPDPTLFDTSWDDRTPFASGLLADEQAILQGLPGATIYHMELVLEESMTVVNGRQEIRYTNQETVPLNQLYFHLFPNLLGGETSIENVHVNGQPVATELESDNSLLRVPFAAPLEPNQPVVVQMNFRTIAPQELGRNYGIFAFADDILALAHFYPMVSVYDDELWNIAQPAEGGDVTYGDTSFYQVRITAPVEQVIASSGVTLARTEADGQQTITVAAGPMRDFYLAASSRYEVLSETVDGITINSFAPAGLSNGSQLALDTAVAAVRSFNGRFAPYPYTELDLVTTSTLALGVEYPGIIANALRIYDEGNGQPNRNFLESTTAHEVAHQWFYGLVGNDQLDEPWLDESVTQYATWLYYLDRYGEQGAKGFYQSLESRWNSTGQANTPLGLPVGHYSPIEYSSIIYGRGPIFVNELAQQVGEETFAQFLKRYQQEFRWQIATTETFQTLLEQECGCRLDPFFTQNIYGSE